MASIGPNDLLREKYLTPNDLLSKNAEDDVVNYGDTTGANEYEDSNDEPSRQEIRNNANQHRLDCLIVGQDDESDDEDGDCCQACGDTRKINVVYCGGPRCKGFLHKSCIEIAAGQEGQDIFCSAQCRSDYVCFQALNLSQDDEPEHEDLDLPLDIDTELAGDDVNLVAARKKIRTMVETKPFVLASLAKFVSEGSGISQELHNDFVQAAERVLVKNGLPLSAEQTRALHKACPPRNIHRSMSSCGDGNIQSIRLTFRFPSKGFEAFHLFHFRSLYDCAMDSFCSFLRSGTGPIYTLDDQQCSGGRLPVIKPLLEAFAKRMKYDLNDERNLTIPIILNSDETASGSSRNNIQNPLWCYLANTDPDARASGVYKYALSAFLPHKHAIQYRNNRSEKLISKKEKITALKNLLRMAHEKVLTDVKKYEKDGKIYQLGGRSVNVRIVLVGYVCDMKERRSILAISQGPFTCSHCYYDFKNQKSGGPRTTEGDNLFRKQYEGQDFNLKTIGLPLKDQCCFTRKPGSLIFTVSGPYRLFPTDPLHLKDGVIQKTMTLYMALLGKETFLESTQRFGNEYLLTGRFSMHLMERGLEGFHFVAFALLFDDSLPIQGRSFHVLGCLRLLEVLKLMNDPCPREILDDLKSAIKKFEEYFTFLLEAVNSKAVAKKKRKPRTHQITPKVNEGSCQKERVRTHQKHPKAHELFSHIVDDFLAFGVSANFSTKRFEVNHEKIHDLFNNSSRRPDTKEMLKAYFHQSAILEHAAQSKPLIERGTKFDPTAKFKISVDSGKKTLANSIQENIQLVCTLLRSDVSKQIPNITKLENQPQRNSKFGNTLTCWIQCNQRNVAITSPFSIVVPGSSKGHFLSGGSFNVVAYRDDDMSVSSTRACSECPLEKCRVHNLQLLCSSSNDGNTGYGIPIIFVGETVLIWKLSKSAKYQCVPKAQSALQEWTWNLQNCQYIPFEAIRGMCMAKAFPEKYPATIFIFTGRLVFGFDV